jgi:hypothetical protein
MHQKTVESRPLRRTTLRQLSNIVNGMKTEEWHKGDETNHFCVYEIGLYHLGVRRYISKLRGINALANDREKMCFVPSDPFTGFRAAKTFLSVAVKRTLWVVASPTL